MNAMEKPSYSVYVDILPNNNNNNNNNSNNNNNNNRSTRSVLI